MRSPTRLAVRAARESLEAAQGELQLAIEEFRSASEAYDTVCRAARGAYADLETARFERDKQQEIHEYAANGYLRGSGDQTSGAIAWLSPAQQLERVQDRRDRARAALAALEGAIDAGQIARSSTDGEYLEAMDSYRDALERYLSFKKVQGDLVAEIARQEAVVEEQEGEFSRIAGEIMRGDSTAYTSEDPLVTAAALESALDPDSSDNEYNWPRNRVFLPAGGRRAPAPCLRSGELCFSEEYRLDGAERVHVGPRRRDRRTRRRGEAARSRPSRRSCASGSSTWMPCSGAAPIPPPMLARWGLAAGYVKQRLHDANRGAPISRRRPPARLSRTGRRQRWWAPTGIWARF